MLFVLVLVLWTKQCSTDLHHFSHNVGASLTTECGQIVDMIFRGHQIVSCFANWANILKNNVFFILSNNCGGFSASNYITKQTRHHVATGWIHHALFNGGRHIWQQERKITKLSKTMILFLCFKILIQQCTEVFLVLVVWETVVWENEQQTTNNKV